MTAIRPPDRPDQATAASIAAHDQARAAAATVQQLRADADAATRFLRIVEGPIADAALRWCQIPKRERVRCPHLPEASPPQPLYGTLTAPGVILCGVCVIGAHEAMPHRCAGCRAPLNPADPPTLYEVLVALDPFLTLTGYACPACRQLCSPPRTTDEHTHERNPA